MAFPEGYCFDGYEDFVRVGREPYVGRDHGEFVVAYYRLGTWVSSVTDKYRALNHEELSGGIPDAGSDALALDGGWVAVSAYGSAGSLGGGSISTVALRGRMLTRDRTERVVGQLLDLGAIGYDWKVEALGEYDEGFSYEGDVRGLLLRG